MSEFKKLGESPWWHGTNYEVLDPLVGHSKDATLQASFTPNNGIRIAIWNEDLGSHLASFDLDRAQAKHIGAKLIAWAERGHG